MLLLLGAGLELGHQVLVSDLTWRLGPGENWAVRGDNGSGKTTLLRLVRGDLWPTTGPGTRTYFEKGRMSASPVGFKRRTGLVSPEFLVQYRRFGWNPTGLDAVCTGFSDTPLLYQEPGADQRRRAREIMARLGLGDLADRSMLEMSLGQAKKVLLARALVNDPVLLVLDECLDGLDAASRQTMLDVIQARAENGTQILFATHRTDELIPAMTHALTLRAGRIVDQGPLTAPESGPTPRFRMGRRAGAVAAGQGGAGRDGDWIIRLENVTVAPEGRPILRGLDWTVAPGQHWAVLGPNGAGKTTLLKLLGGDYQPVTGGRIGRFGPSGPRNVAEIKRRIGYVSAEFQAAHTFGQTVRETVLSGFTGSIGLRGQATAGQRATADARLEACGLKDMADRDVRCLSYGQLRLTLIARAMVAGPRILLLDEPLGGLDVGSRREVQALIAALARGGTTVIYATHQEPPSWVTHGLVIDQGRIARAGAVDEYDIGPTADRTPHLTRAPCSPRPGPVRSPGPPGPRRPGGRSMSPAGA
ncbi:MAG: ATP-binding cassette domain-containing protein [Proteobacteria bacterium]|nr:ATP-binding cassette domain-containing protein [Pseudomonadota bacterium]